MRERPIIFSTPMVQAILAGRKTQTRRVLKQQPDAECYYEMKTEQREGAFGCVINYNQGDKNPFIKFPYGEDIIWVKEAHYCYGRWKKDGLTKTGKQKWKFIRAKIAGAVRYINNPPEIIQNNGYRKLAWYRRNSIFMPKELCRLKLKILIIRLEHLQDISEADAIAEGVESSYTVTRNPGTEYKNYYRENRGGPGFVSARWSFESLWMSINGVRSWRKNPWVWVIEFKRKD